MDTVSHSVGERLSVVMPMRSKSHNSVSSSSGLDSQMIRAQVKLPGYAFEELE